MINKENITVIILAGGKSSRMGVDKGLIKLHNKPLIQHVINNTADLGESQILISNSDDYNQFGLPVYKDVVPDHGPMAGICTGLLKTETDLNIICTCDSPFVTSDLFKLMLSSLGSHDAVIPRYKSHIFPLTALYRKKCLSNFKGDLELRQLKVKETIKSFDTYYLDIIKGSKLYHDKIFTNINTPGDLKKFSNEH